jgi:Large eukaryotic DNA virus major capsid protein/Major capsid protein N-terminus
LTTSGASSAWIDELGHFIINNIDFEIGGARMDKQYGFMLSALQELWGTSEQKDNYDEMIGNTSDLTTASTSVAGKYLYIPLKFWWNRTPGQFMPLVALQKHQLKINVEFEQYSKLVHIGSGGTLTTPSISYASLLVDYVFLDTEERRQFARMAHEYLVETVQYTGVENFSNTNVQQKLNFNHPVSELIVLTQLQSEYAANNLNNFADAATTGHNLTQFKLQLNGQDYQREQEGRYYNLVTPWKTHTNGPRKGLYVFPFAEKPEEFQPSGTVNMSRIDSCTLLLTFASSASINVMTFGLNKNVFRVLSGIKILLFQTVSCYKSFMMTFVGKQCNIVNATNNPLICVI